MTQRSVFVLGHRGMLGHVVSRWLGQCGFNVRTTEARVGHLEDTEPRLFEDLATSECSAVINCIGTTPRRTRSIEGLFNINSVLPQRLAAGIGHDRLLIHASSDAVFDGRRGRYAVGEAPNALDPYGLSKRLGELAVHFRNVVVLRCSIVGLESGEPRNLLAWFLRQKGNVVGYADQMWNGITTLEWAKIAAQALAGDPSVGPGIHQPTCEAPVSKCDLLRAASVAFDHDLEVVPTNSGDALDRTLRSTILRAPIEAQLRELRSWWG